MNLNTTMTPQRRVSERDIEERQRERAAVLEIAEKLDAERRFGIWPPSRPAPLTQCAGPCAQGRRACPSPRACERMQPADEDVDGFGPARGLVAAILITAAAAALAIVLAVGGL